jgi:transposase
MLYSIDLRERVISHVRLGGSQAEASRLFNVSTRTIYNWLKAPDLQPRLAKTRQRKIDESALLAHIRDHPDALLRERAVDFEVSEVAIWKALKRLRVTKKNNEISRG